jgi:hypothetical protein
VTLLRPGILTWKRWAWATGIAVMVSIAVTLTTFHTNWYWAPWRLLFHTPWLLFFSYTFLMAIALAESAVPAGADPPAWRYVLGLVVATALCVAAVWTFPDLVRSAPRQVIAGQTVFKKSTASPEEQARARRVNVTLGFASELGYGWIATFIYMRLRKSRSAARALADAEVDRAEAQRALLAAQLVAANAQVDPVFVLRALEEVERAYESDPAQGDVLLDRFIAYLRDAIPRVRASETPALESA